jgi:hypothetical protein
LSLTVFKAAMPRSDFAIIAGQTSLTDSVFDHYLFLITDFDGVFASLNHNSKSSTRTAFSSNIPYFITDSLTTTVPEVSTLQLLPANLSCYSSDGRRALHKCFAS